MNPENPRFLTQCLHQEWDTDKTPHVCGASGSDITLLDLIAIGAMQGMLASEIEGSPWPEDKLVQRAFKIAVKALEVRERVIKEQGMTGAKKE